MKKGKEDGRSQPVVSGVVRGRKSRLPFNGGRAKRQTIPQWLKSLGYHDYLGNYFFDLKDLHILITVYSALSTTEYCIEFRSYNSQAILRVQTTWWTEERLRSDLVTYIKKIHPTLIKITKLLE